MRTLIIYEYISYVYGKYKQSNYFRFIPLYYMLLRNSNEFSEERLSPYSKWQQNAMQKRLHSLKMLIRVSLQLRDSLLVLFTESMQQLSELCKGLI